jgi:cysteine-rich repeat protein
MRLRPAACAAALGLLCASLQAAGCHELLDFDQYEAGEPGDAGGAGGAAPDGGKTTTSSSGGAPDCGDGDVDPGEQCDDGNNDDGDGCTSDCVYELSDTCPEVALELGFEEVTFMGDTTGLGNDAAGSCSGMMSGETILRIRTTVDGIFVAELDALYDASMWIYDECPPARELDCVNMAPMVIMGDVSAGDDYYLGIDGRYGDAGPFTLRLRVEP